MNFQPKNIFINGHSVPFIPSKPVIATSSQNSELFFMKNVSSRGFSREKLNPLKLMNEWGWDTKHIKFNPDLKESERDFFRNRRCTHDGTSVFTKQMLQDLLVDLANMKCSSNKNPPDKERQLIGINYELGFIKKAAVFGTVNLLAGCYPGMRESATISIKCDYIYS